MANSRAQDNRSTEPQFIYPEVWAQADDMWILQFQAPDPQDPPETEETLP